MTSEGNQQPSEVAEAAGAAQGGLSALFGRGLLYVVVWSLQLVSATLVSPVLAYLLGPTEFGQLASAIALHQVLMVLAVVGLDQALVQQRAEDQRDDSARGLIAVGTVVATVVTVLVGMTAPLWSDLLGFDGVSSLLVATVLWTAPAAAVQLMLGLLLSQDRLRPFSVISCLSAVGGQLFGIGLLIGHAREADVYAWGGVISQFAAAAIGIILTRPDLRGLLNWSVTRRAAGLGLPLTLSMFSMFVLNAGDRVIIQRILGADEVGRYQVAYTVGYVVVLLVSFTSQAWTPRIASVANEVERWNLIAQSRDELYKLLIPVTLGVTLAAPVVLRVVAPSSFEPASLLFVVFLVALSAFPVAASGATGKVLVTERRARPLAVIAGVAAVVNVVLNIALLGTFGIEAAAGGTVLAFALQALLQRHAVPRFPDLPRTPVWLLLACGGVCAVSALTTLLPQTVEWNIARFALALACLPWFLNRLRSARRADASPTVDEVPSPASAAQN